MPYHPEAHRPADRKLTMSKEESEYLYNLLCDNARPWNSNLRKQLQAYVNPTDAFNAKVRLTGRQV